MRLDADFAASGPSGAHRGRGLALARRVVPGALAAAAAKREAAAIEGGRAGKVDAPNGRWRARGPLTVIVSCGGSFGRAAVRREWQHRELLRVGGELVCDRHCAGVTRAETQAERLWEGERGGGGFAGEVERQRLEHDTRWRNDMSTTGRRGTKKGPAGGGAGAVAAARYSGVARRICSQISSSDFCWKAATRCHGTTGRPRKTKDRSSSGHLCAACG